MTGDNINNKQLQPNPSVDNLDSVVSLRFIMDHKFH